MRPLHLAFVLAASIQVYNLPWVCCALLAHGVCMHQQAACTEAVRHSLKTPYVARNPSPSCTSQGRMHTAARAHLALESALP